jgi:hypothetical protein
MARSQAPTKFQVRPGDQFWHGTGQQRSLLSLSRNTRRFALGLVSTLIAADLPSWPCGFGSRHPACVGLCERPEPEPGPLVVAGTELPPASRFMPVQATVAADRSIAARSAARTRAVGHDPRFDRILELACRLVLIQLAGWWRGCWPSPVSGWSSPSNCWHSSKPVLGAARHHRPGRITRCWRSKELAHFGVKPKNLN